VLYHFTDADPNAAVGHYLATVNWGDGASNTSADGSGAVEVVKDPDGGFDVVGTHVYLTATSPGTIDEPPLTFGVEVTHGSASMPAPPPVPGSGALTLSGTALPLTGAGAEGTIIYVLAGGPAVTLHTLHSLRFVGSGGGSLTVNLDPSTPLLPTAIRFDAAD